MAKFKTYKVDLGDVQNGSQNRVFFPFDEVAQKDVLSASPACGCTKPTIEKDGISAIYNASSGHTYPKLITVSLDENKWSGFDNKGKAHNKVLLEVYANVI